MIWGRVIWGRAIFVTSSLRHGILLPWVFLSSFQYLVLKACYSLNSVLLFFCNVSVHFLSIFSKSFSSSNKFCRFIPRNIIWYTPDLLIILAGLLIFITLNILTYFCQCVNNKRDKNGTSPRHTHAFRLSRPRLLFLLNPGGLTKI